MRRSILFWNQQILWRATIPSWYLWGFFTLLAFRNSFLGVFPPVVGLCFLQAGSLSTKHRWPSLWSHLGELLGWWWLRQSPHLPELHYLCHPPLHLLQDWRGFHFWDWGVHWYWGFLLRMHLCPGSYLQGLPALPPLWVFSLYWPILEKKTSQSEARAASWDSHVISFELLSICIVRIFCGKSLVVYLPWETGRRLEQVSGNSRKKR